VRYSLDPVKGHALIFDGPKDLIDTAARVQAADPKVRITPYFRFTGREGNSWKDAQGFISKPWPEAVSMVERIVEQTKDTPLPSPKSARRKPRWSDNDGEVDVDRAMQSEPDLYRKVSREHTSGPLTVSLICNVDVQSTPNKTGVYWRSAAAVAAADLLEQAGYSTEVWFWVGSRYAYPDPHPHQCVFCRIKEAGQPLDIDALCDTLSHWFLKAAFASFDACPTRPTNIGGIDDKLGGWMKHMDVQGTYPVEVPIVFSPAAAVEATRTVLQTVVDAQKNGQKF